MVLSIGFKYPSKLWNKWLLLLGTKTITSNYIKNNVVKALIEMSTPVA